MAPVCSAVTTIEGLPTSIDYLRGYRLGDGLPHQKNGAAAKGCRAIRW